jgi:hypothetical protein
METVYVVVDEGDGTLIGVFTSKSGAERGIMRCALKYDDCNVLQVSKEESEYNTCCTYYRIDYLEFSVTETTLED